MKKLQELKNPYTLQFSYIPPKLITRTLAVSEILQNFTREVPTYRGMFVTGVRGSGKTVMMSDIRNRLGADPDWITVDLNPESDLLDSLARGLYLIPEIKALFIKAKLDFSFMGIGIKLENAELIASNASDALKIMLTTLKSVGKKLLVTIDEITYNQNVAAFSHALSSYSSADYDIYVLMTGLIENIKEIKNQKSLTFLYRAKIIELEMLNLTAIRSDYEETLGISTEWADDLAYLTMGYSLAYQAVGYLYWNAIARSKKEEDINRSGILSDLDQILAEMAYDKIWEELSNQDIRIIKTLADFEENGTSPMVKVENIRKTLKMTSDTFTKYRTRLIDSGIVDGSRYGYLSIRLPRFIQYIRSRKYY